MTIVPHSGDQIRGPESVGAARSDGFQTNESINCTGSYYSVDDGR